MRNVAIALTVAAGFAASPAFACPMMNQASAQTGSAAGSMKCGRAMPTAQIGSQPGQSTQPGQQAAGGCACCRNMAMMQPQPGQGSGGMGGMGHQMPGMHEMPGMLASPPSGNSAPEAPKR
jgi:hypothetical protein